jgi:hypothetical protein
MRTLKLGDEYSGLLLVSERDIVTSNEVAGTIPGTLT